MEAMHCLFCKEKLERPPFQSQNDGTLTRVKGSLFPSEDHDYSIPPAEDIPLVFSDEGQDSLVHDHLKTFFVLKGILKIRDEVLCELLGLKEGKSRPENWINVCGDCGKLVRKFYEDLKQFCTLERRLIRTEWVLREKINKSRGKEGGDDPISERIRSEAMQVYDDNVDNDNPSVRDTPNSKNSFEMDGTEEEYAVPSPSSSFVPDSPSKPFEFWDSEEENEDDQRQSIEKTETNKDSNDAHVEDENETDGEEPPQPIYVDLVTDDEDAGKEKDKATKPPPSQVKITTDPKPKTSVRNGGALTNSTHKANCEGATQKDTSSNKNVAQKGPTSQKGTKGIVKLTRSIETQTLRTAQDKRNTNNQVAPNPTQVSSNLPISPSEASPNCSTKVSKTSATAIVENDQESDVNSDNPIEIESLNFAEIDGFQKFCNETNYGSDCELELAEVMWRAEQAQLPPPTTLQEHLPFSHIVPENQAISERETVQNGVEGTGNQEMLRIPDPNNPYYGLIWPPEYGFVFKAPPPPPVHFYLKTLEPQPVPFELQQNERISSSSPPVLTPPNSVISPSHSSYDNATNLNLLAMVAETARVNGEHPTPPNSTTQELQVELESPYSELRIEINETPADIDSSTTTSALTTPMCLSSSVEENSRNNSFSSCSSFSGSEHSEINLISDEENESSDDEGPPHLEPEVDLAPPPSSGSSRK